jgi:hypothetical protein
MHRCVPGHTTQTKNSSPLTIAIILQAPKLLGWRCSARAISSSVLSSQGRRSTARLPRIVDDRGLCRPGARRDYAAKMVNFILRIITHRRRSDVRFLAVFIAVLRLRGQRWCHF